MSKLIVLSGVPGSGKSHFTKMINSVKKSHLYIVSSDALRTIICGTQTTMKYDNIMWPMYYDLAKAYSGDPDALTILDSTNSSTFYRVEKNRELAKLYDEIILVLFHLDKEIVLNQNINREFPIPQDALVGLIDKFEMPNDIDKNFFNKIYIIENHEFEKVVEEIVK